MIYEQATPTGRKVQAAGNNMAQTDSAVVARAGEPVPGAQPAGVTL